MSLSAETAKTKAAESSISAPSGYVLEPARSTLENGKVRLALYDWGNAEARTMLMLHGTTQSARSFIDLARDFAADYHAMAIDLRGHGESDWQPDGKYRHEDLVSDIEKVLERTDGSILVGASMSGFHSLQLAASKPHKVSALVLVDILPTVNFRPLAPVLKYVGEARFASFEDAVTEVQRKLAPNRTREQLADRLSQQLMEKDGVWRFRFDPAFMALAENLDRFWEFVPKVQAPILLLRGEKSTVTSEEGVARFLNEARHPYVETVPNAGHATMGDNPQGCIAAIRRFLQKYSGNT